MLFLDLAKAFDSVSHDILLRKLRNLGFRTSTVNWFESYLSERKQVTVVDDEVSDVRQINCGVPQGSILGPLLFICYINDLARNCLLSTPFIYADDTALLVHGNNAREIEAKLGMDLKGISSWFHRNKLSLNSQKTKSMLFCGNRSTMKHETLSISVNNTPIENVDEMKYLGMTLDRHLSFDKHVNKVCGKVASRTGLLWRICGFIDFELAKTIYMSLIYPHFLYGNFLLDGTTMVVKHKLRVAQNNALRAVLKVEYICIPVLGCTQSAKWTQSRLTWLKLYVRLCIMVHTRLVHLCTTTCFTL